MIQHAAKSRDFSVYSDLLDAAMESKKARIMRFLRIRPGVKIIDVGTGTGTLAAAIALENRSIEVIGIDIQKEMIDIAKSKYRGIPNLQFKQGYAGQNYNSNGDADAVVMATVQHEIYSYSGDSYHAIDASLAVANRSLKQSGIIVIKDFVKPYNSRKVIHLVHKKDDLTEINSFAKFAAGFRRYGRPVTYKVIAETESTLTIKTDLASAYEYIFRKDYQQNWQAELAEQYGFISLEGMKQRLEKAGFRIKHATTSENKWITENRIKNKVWLVDPSTGKQVDIPDYDMLVVAEKIR